MAQSRGQLTLFVTLDPKCSCFPYKAIMWMTLHLISKSFVRFMFAGAVGATVNIFARIVLGFIMPYEASIVLAFPIALTAGFILNRIYVFNSVQNAATGQYIKYTMVNLIALPPVWIISVVLARWLFPALGFVWHADTIAHGIGLLAPVALSYFVHKTFTFSSSSKTNP